MSATVTLSVQDAVATIRLDRPPMNALDSATQEAVAAAAGEVAERADVRAVVVWGGPKVFAAGADVKEMVELTYADVVRRAGRISACLGAIAGIPQPVVAAINGYALGGGCEVALAADLRVAAADATLGQPEIALGIIPGGGGTQRLARLVGPAVAKDLIFSGRPVKAAEALELGLVNRVVPAEQVYAEACAWAAQLAAGPALALRAAKAAIDGGLQVDLASGLALESALFAGLFATEDCAHGLRSFVDNGPGRARFVGR